MTEAPAEPDRFQPLGEYELPAMPAVHAARRLATMLRQRLQSAPADPVLTADRLQRSSSDEIDRIAAPPAHASLMQELQRSLAGWCDDPEPASWSKLVVLPPGDRPALLRAWAEAHGHSVLEAPPRTDLLAATTLQAGDLQGPGVLVIPDLARWFLRHRSALQSVRTLLTLLSQIERHCLIGCNSWAWAFLCRAVGADLLLPPAMTFKAFDATRLQRWFKDLAAGNGAHPAVTFRLAESGADVLAMDDSGTLANAYLRRLAARSFGIPWVAWHLWRLSLRSRLEGDGLSEKAGATLEQATQGDERTVWVVGFNELALPKQHEEGSLLVLQALLIHGELSASELRAVLPPTVELDLVPALMRAGYVQRLGQQFHVLPTAYPQAREALAAAGYPLDRL